MKVLFITSNRLGDAILSTGVLAHYLREYPGAEVTVVCGRIAAPIFRAVPGILDVVTVDKKRFALHWLGPFFKFAFRRWDLMVDLRDVTIMKLVPARRRIFDAGSSGSRHRLEDFAALIESPNDVPTPQFWFDEAAIARANQLIPADEFIIGVAPVTGPKRKLWRPDRYAAVLQTLTAPGGVMAGARVAVFAAPNEAASAQQLTDLLPPEQVINLVGATDPLEAAAAIGECGFFLGVDSGLMHAAAALDVPTVGLFGEHGVPMVYRPWGSRSAYVHRRNPDWNAKVKPSGMDGISVEDVVLACETLIRRPA